MADKPPSATNLDMFTMVVLRRRIEAIIREMTNALFRSGRSGVLNTAMDFSSSLTDVREVIDICRANIRVPDQFYGDYLATLSAVRTGEQRLVEFCDKYGPDVVKAFLDDFQQYAERMTVEAIRKLPAGTVRREMHYDSEIAEYPDGIPIRASLTIDPQAGKITIDLT